MFVLTDCLPRGPLTARDHAPRAVISANIDALVVLIRGQTLLARMSQQYPAGDLSFDTDTAATRPVTALASYNWIARSSTLNGNNHAGLKP
jgi:hypothetical protein